MVSLRFSLALVSVLKNVMAKNETNEPRRSVSSAIGVAAPKNRTHYGYLSEHHTFGETAAVSGDYSPEIKAFCHFIPYEQLEDTNTVRISDPE